jgi:DNA-directed RNA polymerase I subunit RPA1
MPTSPKSNRIYTDEEVRSRSVIEVTSPQAFDALGTPLPHGLYDPLLGPTDSKNTSPCPTCGNLYINCPGHAGHIELCVPVYQPLTFPKLMQLLKIKCLACHRFRLGKIQVKTFAAKFHLIDCGRLKEALELDDNISTAVRSGFDSNDENGGKLDIKEMKKEKLISASKSIEAFLDKKLASSPIRQSLNGSTTVLTSHERSARRMLIKEFFVACTQAKKCYNCGAYSPKIRHDNYNKVFQTPLSGQHKKANAGQNIKILPASNFNPNNNDVSGSGWDSDDSEMEDDENDEPTGTTTMSDDEDAFDENAMMGFKDQRLSTVSTSAGASSAQEKAAAKAAKPDKFMQAMEVEAQAGLTWKFETYLCSKIFGCAHTEKDPSLGHSIFFMRAIPVPPARYRPPMVMGTMTVEHAQNHYLNKVMELNDRLRIIFATVQGLDGGDGAEEGVDKDQIQARAISTWIDLQTTINCYIDSSKDPSGGASTSVPNGIRQLLEKKEGMFRK